MGWGVSHLWGQWEHNLAAVEAALPMGVSFPQFIELMRLQEGKQKAAWTLEIGNFVLRILARADDEGVGFLPPHLVRRILEEVWGPLSDQEFNGISRGVETETNHGELLP